MHNHINYTYVMCTVMKLKWVFVNNFLNNFQNCWSSDVFNTISSAQYAVQYREKVTVARLGEAEVTSRFEKSFHIQKGATSTHTHKDAYLISIFSNQSDCTNSFYFWLYLTSGLLQRKSIVMFAAIFVLSLRFCTQSWVPTRQQSKSPWTN